MKEKAIIQAVKSLRKSKFGEGVTAIKVELEANLSRGSGSCDAEHVCYECNGDWEDHETCDSCDGHGYYRREEGGEWEICNYDEYEEANGREGMEAVECEGCAGSGASSCGTCEEGYVECDGDCESSEWGSDRFCRNFLMEKLSKLGLAEHLDGRWRYKGALAFAKFYTDGSVDSEFTFTIMLDNPDNIFILPKVIKAWNELGDAVGNGMEVRGAGMHMALLSTPDGSYGRGYDYSQTQRKKFANFKKAMQLLLPALYCLGASNEESRGLAYRVPRIEMESHRAAIDYRNGALEFRIFDTCYANPEQILDNVVVISKCMRYWNTTYVPNNLGKITKAIKFGDGGGNNLERFYRQTTHIDLLNAGLKKLKPGYYTITEIKQQRKMTINKRTIGSALKRYRQQLEVEYTEYVDRFDWSLLANKHRWLADAIDGNPRNTPQEMLEQLVAQRVEARKQERQSLSSYVNERLSKYNSQGSEYTLVAE